MVNYSRKKFSTIHHLATIHSLQADKRRDEQTDD